MEGDWRAVLVRVRVWQAGGWVVGILSGLLVLNPYQAWVVLVLDERVPVALLGGEGPLPACFLKKRGHNLSCLDQSQNQNLALTVLYRPRSLDSALDRQGGSGRHQDRSGSSPGGSESRPDGSVSLGESVSRPGLDLD